MARATLLDAMADAEGMQAFDGDAGDRTIQIRALVAGTQAGSIIGKGGAIIQQLREESGARINLSDSVPGVPDRVLTVVGTLDVAMRAMELILNALEEMSGVQQQQQARTAADAGEEEEDGADEQAAMWFKLLIPSSQIGCIIGKGGSVVNGIRQASGTQIQIQAEPLPDSTERAVNISGGAVQISDAVQEICQRLAENPAKGSVVLYRPRAGMFYGGQAQAGYGGSGGRGHPGQAQGRNGGAPFRDYYNAGYAPYDAGAGQYAGYAGGYDSGAAFAGAGAAPGGYVNSSMTQINVQNELVGSIIGKGGATIREIRQISGAGIRVSDAVPGSMDRVVTITGSPDAQQLAWYHLNLKIQTSAQLLQQQQQQQVQQQVQQQAHAPHEHQHDDGEQG